VTKEETWNRLAELHAVTGAMSSGKLTLSGKANLIEVDLSGANLGNANLSGAHLCYSNLSGANIVKPN